MVYETEVWPYIEAKHHGPKRTTAVTLLVLHTPEWPESASGAEAVAKYFHDMPDGRIASCHVTSDSDSIVQCVKDSYVAYAAPGANHNGIQWELTGFAGQTKAQWRDKFSLAALALAADGFAQYLLKYNLPPIHLSDDQLRDGRPGIVGHDQVSRVFKKSDHMDPGTNFPWLKFITWVKGSYEDRKV